MIGYKNFKVQTNIHTRIVGSFIICFSALLLCADKLVQYLPFEIKEIHGFSSLEDYVWVLMQSVAPLVIIVGTLFKPFKITYLVPTYVYCLQLSWSLSENTNDHYLANAYAMGIFCTLMFSVLYILNKIDKRYKKIRSEELEFIEESKEVLEILKAKILKEEL